jgi:hypothetical protein
MNERAKASEDPMKYADSEGLIEKGTKSTISASLPVRNVSEPRETCLGE